MQISRRKKKDEKEEKKQRHSSKFRRLLGHYLPIDVIIYGIYPFISFKPRLSFNFKSACEFDGFGYFKEDKSRRIFWIYRSLSFSFEGFLSYKWEMIIRTQDVFSLEIEWCRWEENNERFQYEGIAKIFPKKKFVNLEVLDCTRGIGEFFMRYFEMPKLKSLRLKQKRFYGVLWRKENLKNLKRCKIETKQGMCMIDNLGDDLVDNTNDNNEYFNIMKRPSVVKKMRERFPFLENKYVILAIIKDRFNNNSFQAQHLFNFFTESQLLDKDFALEAIKIDSNLFMNFKLFHDDRDFVMAGLDTDGLIFSDLRKEFRNDREIVMAAVSKYGNNLSYAHEKFRKDREIVMMGIKATIGKEKVAKIMDESFRDDKEIIIELETPQKNTSFWRAGCGYSIMGPKLKNDKEFLLERARTTDIKGRILQYSSKELKDDFDFVKKIIKIDPRAILYTSERIRENKVIALEVVKRNGLLIEIFSKKLKGDEDVAMAAVKENGFSLMYCDVSIRANKRIVLEAVKNKGESIIFAFSTLTNDKDVVMEAVRNNGEVLQFCTKFGGYKKIVIQAVKSNGLALEFASKDLKNDKELVMEAVKNNGMALEFASESLKKDMDVTFEAIKKDVRAMEFASREAINSLKLY